MAASVPAWAADTSAAAGAPMANALSAQGTTKGAGGMAGGLGKQIASNPGTYKSLGNMMPKPGQQPPVQPPGPHPPMPFQPPPVQFGGAQPQQMQGPPPVPRPGMPPGMGMQPGMLQPPGPMGGGDKYDHLLRMLQGQR